MKLKNLLLSFAATLALGTGLLSVNAAGLTTDELAKCKTGTDGKPIVYTNYYYFLAAQVYQDAYDYGNDLTATYETRANYTNNIILAESAKEKGLMLSKGIYRAMGNVPISTSATSSDGISNMNIVDFYTQYIKADNYSDGAYKDGNYIARMVKHGWDAVEKGEYWPQAGSAKTTATTALEFAKASLKLANNGLSFGTPGVPANGIPANDLSINIKRNYSGATPYYPESEYEPLVDKTDSNKTWWVQPALYYIQYCEAATETQKEEQKSTETKEYTVSYNPNKGVNAPASVTADATKGVCVTIADAGNMSRTGYKFVGWNTSSTATAVEKGFAVGDKYCGETGDKTLYAIWEVENPDTGVNAHILAFGVAVIAAGSALVVARKKGLFKQI